MSSASSHSEVISRKPSGSCLIHPSISSSSSDYDEGEEFDLFSENLKEPNPEDLLVRPTRGRCPGILDSNLLIFFAKAKGILYLRRRARLSRISCTFLPFHLCVSFPDITAQFDIVIHKPSPNIESFQVQEQIRPPSLFDRILAFFSTKPCSPS